jgi:hypothetical protein
MSTRTPHAAEAVEAERQQALLATLWPAHGPHGDTPSALAALAVHLDPTAAVPATRGLQAYRATAGAVAERALGAAFPVLRALIGDDDFAAFARAYWLAQPPVRGDLARLGDGLADFIADDPRLRDAPYLADVARLEAAVARAESAADDGDVPADGLASLQRLADTDPSRLALVLAPGTTLLRSAWPVASLWLAHGADSLREAGAPLVPDERALAEAGRRLAAREAEHALVWRVGWRVRVTRVDAGVPEAAFLSALVDRRDLATALDRAAAVGDFPFDAWLARALADGVLRGAIPLPPSGAPP